jgi:hypothetical protein
MDTFIAVVVTLIVAYVVTRYFHNRETTKLIKRQERELDLAFARAFDDGYATGYEQRKLDESRERIEKTLPKKN